MSYNFSVKVFFVFAFLKFVSSKLWYDARFTDSIKDCKDFNNEVIQASEIKLKLKETAENEEPACALSGPLILKSELDEGVNVLFNVYKETEVGKEYFMKTVLPFCDTIKDKDTPWYPMFDKLNIKGCPVGVANFTLEEFMLNLDSCSDLLCHDFCGEYSVEMCLEKEVEKIACFMIEIAIVECSD